MAPKKGVLAQVESKSGAFAVVFLLLFGITFGFLMLVGATPDAPGTTKDSDLALNGSDGATATSGQTPASAQQGDATPATSISAADGSGQLPTRVIISKIGLNVTVSNPDTTDANVLDNALSKGAVRYPTSGSLGQNGTVLLFGHSSYLPIVHNQAYKTFDGIQDLKPGDIISVYSGSTEYRFSVTGVKVADATSDVVELPADAQHLTLVTCDSFATKSNRFVVTADLVSTN